MFIDAAVEFTNKTTIRTDKTGPKIVTVLIARITLKWDVLVQKQVVVIVDWPRYYKLNFTVFWNCSETFVLLSKHIDVLTG